MINTNNKSQRKIKEEDRQQIDKIYDLLLVLKEEAIPNIHSILLTMKKEQERSMDLFSFLVAQEEWTAKQRYIEAIPDAVKAFNSAYNKETTLKLTGKCISAAKEYAKKTRCNSKSI